MNEVCENDILNIEMRSLIFEALSTEDKEDTPRKSTFKMYNYKGTIDDLFRIVEYLAIKHGLVKKLIDIPDSAWGGGHMAYFTGSTTNFNTAQLNTFYEEFYFLLYQNVISPYAYGNYGEELPNFHVTQYGLECLASQEILPYDPDKYLEKLGSFQSVDEWELYYISQCLKCYNAGALDAALMMLGLSGEYLAERLVLGMGKFLQSKELNLYEPYMKSLDGETIAKKYNKYENTLEKIEKMKDKNNLKYPEFRALRTSLDISARPIYATYLRLTRNEVAHPANIQMDKIQCLTLITAYIKYSETQHNYLNLLNISEMES